MMCTAPFSIFLDDIILEDTIPFETMRTTTVHDGKVWHNKASSLAVDSWFPADVHFVQ